MLLLFCIIQLIGVLVSKRKLRAAEAQLQTAKWKPRTEKKVDLSQTPSRLLRVVYIQPAAESA